MRKVHFCYIMFVEFHLHWMIQQIIRHNNGLSTMTLLTPAQPPKFSIGSRQSQRPGRRDVGGTSHGDPRRYATDKSRQRDKTSVNTLRLHAQNSVRISVCRHRTYSMTETVWSSSLWISASTSSLSSVSNQCHPGATTCSCHYDRDHWDWTHDNCRTTTHLCTSLHMSCLTASRCPGRECWTPVRYGIPVNYLQTTDSLQVHFTSYTDAYTSAYCTCR